MNDQTRGKATSAAANAEEKLHQAHLPLVGQLPGTDIASGHPLHPGTVHWPIALLTGSFGLQLLHRLPSSYYPASLLGLPVLAQSALPRLAHVSGVAGVLFAVPSILTGVSEGYELVRAEYKKRGSWTQLWQDVRDSRNEGGKKVKMTITHASMNDAVVAVAGYNWWWVHKYGSHVVPGLNVGLGAVALPLLLYSAVLGGKLVYEYAVGVQRQGSGLEVKENMEREKSQ